MYTNLPMEDVIRAVEAFLNMQGYSDDTLYNYHRYGLDFFQNHFSNGKYSEQAARLLVSEAESLAAAGMLSERRFRMIRRTHDLMQMYVSTGSVQYVNERSRCVQEPCGLFLAGMSEFLFQRKANGCSELTIRFEKSVVRNFLLYLESADVKAFSRIEKNTVEAYLLVLQSKWTAGLSEPLCVLRCFLKFCVETGLMETDLSVVLNVRPATKQRVKQGFNNDEIQSILKAIDKDTALGKRNYGWGVKTD